MYVSKSRGRECSTTNISQGTHFLDFDTVANNFLLNFDDSFQTNRVPFETTKQTRRLDSIIIFPSRETPRNTSYDTNCLHRSPIPISSDTIFNRFPREARCCIFSSKRAFGRDVFQASTYIFVVTQCLVTEPITIVRKKNGNTMARWSRLQLLSSYSFATQITSEREIRCAIRDEASARGFRVFAKNSTRRVPAREFIANEKFMQYQKYRPWPARGVLNIPKLFSARVVSASRCEKLFAGGERGWFACRREKRRTKVNQLTCTDTRKRCRCRD